MNQVGATPLVGVAGAPDVRDAGESTGATPAPEQTAQFASNWELSTARAVEVVQILIKEGMNPKALSAAGYSEFDPVAANDTADHKAQNRRIEIVLQPNLADLPSLDDLR